MLGLWPVPRHVEDHQQLTKIVIRSAALLPYFIVHSAKSRPVAVSLPLAPYLWLIVWLSLRFKHEEFCDGLYIRRKTLSLGDPCVQALFFMAG